MTDGMLLPCVAQINMRIERTSLHTILFSSQKRCISPTKTFTDSSGYGCFAYVPIFWMEESRIIRDTEFRDLFVHYYTRPGQSSVCLSICMQCTSKEALFLYVC